MAGRPRAKILESLPLKGFVFVAGSDHDFLWFHYQGKRTPFFVKLSRGTGYKVYNDVLLKAIGLRLHTTRKQTNSLIDCDLDESGYLAILRSQGKIA